MGEGSDNELLKKAVGYVITLLVISAVFGVVFIALAMFNRKTNDVAEFSNKMEASTYTAYDGNEITGSEVVTLAKQWDNGEFFVGIQRSSDKKCWYLYFDGSKNNLSSEIDADENRSRISGLSSKKSDYYVNPTGKFLVEICYDSNGTIVGARFTQQ